MNTLIQAHNNKMNRLVTVSQTRRSKELDFFTDASNNYRSFLYSSSSENKYEDQSLTSIVKEYFINEAQKEDGVLALQTRLNINIKDLSQEDIKRDKKTIANYFSRLDKCMELGGTLIAATDNFLPENLPNFINNYRDKNINGTTEREKDKNMFSLAAWANLFNYFKDVKVLKNFYFRETDGDEIVVFTHDIYFQVRGETFRKYLHNYDYVINDFLKYRNIQRDDVSGDLYYVIRGEIDSNQLDNNELMHLFVSDVPKEMDLGEAFENAGITQNATLQPQFFLGGSIPTEDPNDVEQDTSIQIPMYKIEGNKIIKTLIKPIDTEGINNTPAYNAAIISHIAGLFSYASGNISILSGYSNNKLGLDLPLGINESVTPQLLEMYNSLQPEGKVGFVGNRYAFNTTGYGDKTVSLVDSQKAYIMELILQSNLDKKLPQKNVANGPSIVKELLEDETFQGKELIRILNEQSFPIPEFYKKMLGIKQWEAGMPIFYQKLPPEIRQIPAEQTPEIKEFIEIYS